MTRAMGSVPDRKNSNHEELKLTFEWQEGPRTAAWEELWRRFFQWLESLEAHSPAGGQGLLWTPQTEEPEAISEPFDGQETDRHRIA